MTRAEVGCLLLWPKPAVGPLETSLKCMWNAWVSSNKTFTMTGNTEVASLMTEYCGLTSIMAGGSGVAAILGRDSGPTAILRRDSKAMSKMAHFGLVDFLRVQTLMTSCSADLRGPFRESTRAHWSSILGQTRSSHRKYEEVWWWCCCFG